MYGQLGIEAVFNPKYDEILRKMVKSLINLQKRKKLDEKIQKISFFLLTNKHFQYIIYTGKYKYLYQKITKAESESKL